jgi:hypothetical protein
MTTSDTASNRTRNTTFQDSSSLAFASPSATSSAAPSPTRGAERGRHEQRDDRRRSLRPCKMDLYHCVYVYTIITAVNWRQNGQSSQRDYLTLARRWRPSRSRLSFSPLLYIHFDTVLSNIDLITPTGRRTNTRQSVERRDSAFLNANAATLHSRSHVFETQLA